MKTQKKNVKKKEQQPVFNKLSFALIAADVVLFILGMVDMSGVADFYPVNGLFALIGVSLILITAYTVNFKNQYLSLWP